MLIKLPAPEPAAERGPVFLNEKPTLLLPDLHFPYHNNVAIDAALKKADEMEVGNIVFTGDQLDFYMGSRFSKDPSRKNIAYEVSIWLEFISEVRRYFNKARIYYIKGNHCMRLDHYINNTATALKGLPGVTLAEVLQLKKYRVQLVDDFCPVVQSGLSILHGHEVPGLGFSVSPARGLYLRTGVSGIVGHCHRKSEYSKRTLAGKSIVTFSMGCCCELSPDYMPYNDHVHGFAINLSEKGKFELHNHYVNAEGRVF